MSDLAYRWEVVRVHVGSTMRTRAGVVEVTSLERAEAAAITDADAAGAGFRTADSARTWIARRGDGDLYRVGLRVVGPDPRIALRDDADLDEDAVCGIALRLARMDRAADEPWTRRYLELVATRPAVVARTLAADVGMERDAFKVRVRRLKELGLTESLEVGYRLSPRGRAFLTATAGSGDGAALGG